jgi:hypothetical protein
LKNEREKKKKKKNHKKTTQSREEPKKQKNGKLKMGRGPLPPARVRAFIRPAPRRGICFSLQKKGGEYVLAN